ncbi:class I SAM-dependent methyltransferase [Patescibacteria group bacterium]
MSFFDKHPVLYPWPFVLRSTGLKTPFKPREVWWRQWLKMMDFKKGDQVLEVGCGRGVMLDRLVGEYKVKGFGIDIASQAIKDAKKDCLFKHNLKVASATKLPFKDSQFDKVISFDTLEHIKDQEKAVGEMVRVLRSGGKLLIYTINSHQRLTWNCLLSKLGMDIYSGVDHDPQLFVDPLWLKEELTDKKIRVAEVVLLNSFFTLVLDELIMIILVIWQRFFGWEKGQKFATIILRVLAGFSILVTPILHLLDWPWRLLGLSNSFLVIGKKDEKSS